MIGKQLTAMPWFPEPGSYISQFEGTDPTTKQPVYKFRQLIWRRDPFVYPYRFASQAAGNKSTNGVTFDELEASSTKRHIYLCYIGIKPGFIVYLWHPYDFKNLKWDEDVTTIDEDLTAGLTYDLSPYDHPTKMIGIEQDKYPMLQPLNISGETKNCEVIFVAAKYKIRDHGDLSEDELNRLATRQLKAYPIDFGGEL